MAVPAASLEKTPHLGNDERRQQREVIIPTRSRLREPDAQVLLQPATGSHLDLIVFSLLLAPRQKDGGCSEAMSQDRSGLFRATADLSWGWRVPQPV